jgi:hypothetical protein
LYTGEIVGQFLRSLRRSRLWYQMQKIAVFWVLLDSMSLRLTAAVLPTRASWCFGHTCTTCWLYMHHAMLAAF